MAQIRSNGPGRKTTGKVDGVVYVHVNGKTYAKSSPIMPKSMYETPAAKKRQALFKLTMMHLKSHRGEFDFLFDKGKSWSATNAYHKRNAKALHAALGTLATNMVNGQDVSPAEVEAAISTYAVANPSKIVLADKAPYEVKYLTGPWPATITLTTTSGASTTIVWGSDTVYPTGTSSSSSSNTNPPSNDEPIGE